MNASHFDHQARWWKECECEDCRLQSHEWKPINTLNSEFPGGLHWEGQISSFAYEPRLFFVRCWHCDKLYVVLEPFGGTPMLYPVNPNEEASLTANFYQGENIE